MIQPAKTRGFTLVELLLAMSFLAILLVAIATLTIQVSNIYTRGVTLNAVDQAGQTIVGELQGTLNQSAGNNVESIDVGNDPSNPSGGRLCTGSVSYAWNYGSAITSTDSTLTVNTIKDSNSKDVRFVRFADPSNTACISDPNTNEFLPIPSSATEVLKSSDRDIALSNFEFSESQLGSQTIYSISMTVSTTNSDDFMDDKTCKPPTLNDDSFCAVNTFNFTARSGSMDGTGGGQ